MLLVEDRRPCPVRWVDRLEPTHVPTTAVPGHVPLHVSLERPPETDWTLSISCVSGPGAALRTSKLQRYIVGPDRKAHKTDRSVVPFPKKGEAGAGQGIPANTTVNGRAVLQTGSMLRFQKKKKHIKNPGFQAELVLKRLKRLKRLGRMRSWDETSEKG